MRRSLEKSKWLGGTRHTRGNQELTTPVYATPMGSNGRYKDDTAPALISHLLYAAFDEEERSTDINVERVVELFNGNVPDVGDCSMSVPRNSGPAICASYSSCHDQR